MHMADRAGTDRTYLLESAHVCSPTSCVCARSPMKSSPTSCVCARSPIKSTRKLLASPSPAPARLLLRPSTQSSRKMEDRRKLTPVRPQNRSLRGGGTTTKRCILQRVARPPALNLPLHSGMTLAIRGLIGTHTSLPAHHHPNGETDAKVPVAGRAAPEARPRPAELEWVKNFSSSSPMSPKSPPRSPRSPTSPRASPPSTAESPRSTSTFMVGIEINAAIPGVEGATHISVDALETLRQRLPDGHPAVAKSMVDLGKLYQKQGGWLS